MPQTGQQCKTVKWGPFVLKKCGWFSLTQSTAGAFFTLDYLSRIAIIEEYILLMMTSFYDPCLKEYLSSQTFVFHPSAAAGN